MSTLWVLQYRYREGAGWCISNRYAPFRTRAEARLALKKERNNDWFAYRLTKYVMWEVAR